MKKFFAILAAIVFATTLTVGGCTYLKTEQAKIETTLKATDWVAVSQYYDKAIGGLQMALTVIGQVFPASAPEVTLISGAVSGAKLAGDTLCQLAENYKVGGTVTTAQLTDAAQAVDEAYNKAKNAVGGLLAKTSPTVPTQSGSATN